MAAYADNPAAAAEDGARGRRAVERHFNWWGNLMIPLWTLVTLSGFCVYRFRETRAMTMGQFLEVRYSRKLRTFTAILQTLSGLLVFGLFPAVGARFFVYFLDLPLEVTAFGLAWPTFALLMAFFLGIAVLIANFGGQIAIMTSDCVMGILNAPAQIEFLAPRGDVESAQLVVFNTKREPVGVEITATELMGPASSGIRPHIRRVDYVSVFGLGDWPDPLVESCECTLDPGQWAVFLVTVVAPAECPPGVHAGAIMIGEAGGASIRVPAEFHVADYTLGRQSTFRTLLYLTPSSVQEWYGREISDRDEWRPWMDLVLANRVGVMLSESPADWGVRIARSESGAWEFDFSQTNAIQRHCLDAGAACLSIGPSNASLAAFNDPTVLDQRSGTVQSIQLDPHERNELAEQFCAAAFENYRDMGCADRCYLKVVDEPDPEDSARSAEIEAFCQACHRGWPGLKLMITQVPSRFSPGLRDSLGAWVPLVHEFEDSDLKHQHSLSRELWFYVCNFPQSSPYGGFSIASPGILHRILPWNAWRTGADGLLYWGLSIFPNRYNPGLHRSPDPENRWPAVPWDDWICNGDGYLIYPGESGPLASLRLECLRDGIEDWESLHFLRSLVGQCPEAPGALRTEAEDLLSLDGLMPPEPDGPPELTELLKRRELVIRCIEKLLPCQMNDGPNR